MYDFYIYLYPLIYINGWVNVCFIHAYPGQIFSQFIHFHQSHSGLEFWESGEMACYKVKQVRVRSYSIYIFG